MDYFFLIENHVCSGGTGPPFTLTESEKYFFSAMDLQLEFFCLNGSEEAQVDTASDGVSWIVIFLA